MMTSIERKRLEQFESVYKPVQPCVKLREIELIGLVYTMETKMDFYDPGKGKKLTGGKFGPVTLEPAQ